MRYQREKAIQYALKWALDRNPNYYNYDKIGGDCTNFVSQCLYAGISEMNYQRNGWYYRNANLKSPSWTGVEFLYQFLIQNKKEGPKGKEIGQSEIKEGDVIQLSFDGKIYGHTLIVTEIRQEKILVSAHTIDAKNRELSTYNFKKIRYIQIF